jgi:tetratricopeptide (TPR) repeat protein
MEFVEKQLLAAEYLVQDKYDEAIAFYEQCIDLAPDVMSNYWELGLALLLQGEELEAQALWLSAILEGSDEQVEAKTAELINVLKASGLQRIQSCKYQQAEKIYWQILELNENNSEAYKNLGTAVLYQGKVEDAIAHYQQAINLDPNYAIAYYHLGCAFQTQGNIEEAIAHFQKAINLDPNYPIFHHNLGATFQIQDKLEEAIAHFQQALILDPNYVIAYNSLGVALAQKQNFSQAIDCFNRAIELAPDNGEAHWNRGFIRLLCGDYKGGFADYEWRWIAKKVLPRSCPQPIWSGEDLEGRTILLHTEQGFGDTIQFVRYAPLVQQRGGNVILECQEPLVRLLTTVPGIKKVVARGTTLPEFDVHAPLLSLPYILGTTLETVPAQIPYLNYDEFFSFRLDSPDPACLKVGIVWGGSPENPQNAKRSCSLGHFFNLLHTPGIAFYSLQKEPAVVELDELSGVVPPQDLSSLLGDFADTAAVIAQLDLIISVDTAVAHLAGALGKPVWVLLAFNADWRWIVGRSDSPWYPSMRLFHQQRPGDWAELLSRVQAALQELRDAN